MFKRKVFIFVFAAAFICNLCIINAKTNDRTGIRAGMISNLFDFIKGATKKDAPEEPSIPEDDETFYINVYFHKEGVIRRMALDDYLKGVLYGEVPESYHKEALKAQAVAARSYALYRIRNGISHENGADICTDYTHCQAWAASDSGKYPDSISSAVDDTSDIISTYNGKCINAMYFSNSGGYTESIGNVWDGSDTPYLTSVQSPGESDNYDFCSVKYYTSHEFAARIKEYDNTLPVDEDDAFWKITDIQRTPTGRIISAKIYDKTFTGQQIRSMFGTLSSNIHFEKISDDAVVIVSLGYGHGVGMSQCGAQAMALQGYNFEDILKHYYTGTELSDINLA